MTELTTTRHTARELAEQVRTGRASATELVRDALARIDTLDSELHAFAHVRRAEALAEATAVDESADRPSLPLAGVPVAVKDNVAVAGAPRRHGSRATSAAPVQHDDELVRRLREAGAVIVGTTRMPELAVWPFTEFEHDEAVVNPWNRDLPSGGSSGGAAVAVATGMAALAVGSDGGGSLRVPAACCGVVGFKSSRDLVSAAGGDADHWRGLTVWGPIAADVADAALLLDVLAGTERFRGVVAPTAPLRVAVSVRAAMPGARVHADARAATLAAADALRSAGHEVTEADPPYPRDLGPRFSRRWLPGIADDARGLDPSALERRTRRMARAGRTLDRLGLAAAAPDAKLAERMRRWFERFDVLLTPTLADPNVQAGRWQGKGWVQTTLGVGNWLLTTPWNLVGFPAISVPAPTSSHSAPVGIQLVAPAGADAIVLAAARAVEEAGRETAPS